MLILLTTNLKQSHLTLNKMQMGVKPSKTPDHMITGSIQTEICELSLNAPAHRQQRNIKIATVGSSANN